WRAAVAHEVAPAAERHGGAPDQAGMEDASAIEIGAGHGRLMTYPCAWPNDDLVIVVIRA
ncbi:MAG TPA: hypothetical protein VGR62_05195, partial [Candidatus Binatia bacterium]|nr:hypothetical protein [Candidatus Binatia bacterium]